MRSRDRMNEGASRRVRARLRSRFKLTAREAEVALLLGIRRTNREIAESIGVTEHTARHHTESVLRKLGVPSRIEVHNVITVDLG